MKIWKKENQKLILNKNYVLFVKENFRGVKNGSEIGRMWFTVQNFVKKRRMITMNNLKEKLRYNHDKL